MASALQKLFRKRISKHQLQEQRQKQGSSKTTATEAESSSSFSRSETLPSLQPYLTVSSLNSPSSSTTHFPFSSKLSLDSSFANQASYRGTESRSPPKHDGHLTRANSSSLSLDHRPRASSLSAQSMLREYSGASARGWRNSALSDGEPFLDQFGGFLPPVSDAAPDQAMASAEEEDEDLDRNPLYGAVSQRPDLQRDWNMAKLVLVPCKQQLVSRGEVGSGAYVALHALVPSNLFKDQYVSVCSSSKERVADDRDPWADVLVTATLEAESRSVHLLLTRQATTQHEAIRFEHTAVVKSETTVYRSMTSQETSLAAHAASSSFKLKRPSIASARKERVRIRVLILDRLVIPKELNSNLTMSEDVPQRAGPIDGEHSMHGEGAQSSQEAVVFPMASPCLGRTATESPQPASPKLVSPSETMEDGCPIPLRRHFLADYAFLLDPPSELHKLERALHAALETLVRTAGEFTTAFVYVPGFDAYNVSRIRRGILSKAWQAFEFCREEEGNPTSEWPMALLGGEGRARLLLLLENVVLGHCHGKIYSSIQIASREADQRVDNIIWTYQELHVSLEDLGVGIPTICKRPAYLERAIFIMQHLGDADEDMAHLLENPDACLFRRMAKQGSLAENSGSSVEYAQEKNRVRIRTPLDALDVLHATLEEIGLAISRAQKASMERQGFGVAMRGSLGTDELLPVLAYVIISAGPMKLVSLLYYVRQFGLSDAISSQLNWALVTYEAVIEYLRKDPLQLCAAVSSKASSLHTPPLSAHTPKTLSFRSDGTEIEQTEAGRGNRRARRSSLPSSVLLSSTCSDFTELSSTRRSPRVSGDLASSAGVFEVSDAAPVDEGGFKLPGRPASAYAGFPRTRVMSALDAVGEDGSMTSGDLESPPLASHSFRSSSTSKRTTSMSGSGELLIRPQIVVRQRRPSQARSGSDSASAAEHDPSPSEHVRMGERTLSLGGKKMNRTSSEEASPASGGVRPSIAVQVPRQARRKSLDSWTAFSFFGGSSVHPATGTSTAADISPSTSSQEFAPAGASSSPPSAWLSSWTSEWGQSRKETGGSATRLVDSVFGSRPASIASNDCPPPLVGGWSPTQSSSTQSNLAALASMKTYSNNNTVSDMASRTTSSSLAKKSPSIRSNASSSNSHQQTRSDDSNPTERRFKPSRTRLLSVSSPTEPLPPRLYAESAAADYFRMVSSSSSQDGQATPYSSARSAADHAMLSFYPDVGSPSTDQLTPRSFTPGESTSIATGFFSPSFAKVQIPSPVDEISDPMARVKVT